MPTVVLESRMLFMILLAEGYRMFGKPVVGVGVSVGWESFVGRWGGVTDSRHQLNHVPESALQQAQVQMSDPTPNRHRHENRQPQVAP